MSARVLVLAALLVLGSTAVALGAELVPIEQLNALPLSFWATADAQPDGDSVRSAYLRGFLEATRLWANMKDQKGQRSALFYLAVLRGMSIPQLSNMVKRVAEEHPDQKDKMSLTEAVTACVIRARTGQPLVGEKPPAKAPASTAPQAAAPQVPPTTAPAALAPAAPPGK